MSNSPATSAPTSEPSHIEQLQEMLRDEIPMCAQMGIEVHDHGVGGLVMRLPLDPNRNHQQTAFAGSLNALCTIAGWGTVFLLLKELGRQGSVVIRRSSIRYHRPVDSSEITALCLPVSTKDRDFFLEMLDEKGQAKLDLSVEIPGETQPSVAFQGSYVVMAEAN